MLHPSRLSHLLRPSPPLHSGLDGKPISLSSSARQPEPHSSKPKLTMNLLLLVRSGKLHLLRPSLHLFLTKTPYPYPFASSSSSKFSTSNAEAPPAKPHFSAVDYLIQSCGLSSEEALRASKKIDHLKSPDKPESVLQFLRETGVGDSDIRKAVFRDSHILRSSVKKNWRPNVVKLQELGFSIQDISHLVSRHPSLFTFNIVSRIDFWMCTLGSIESLSAFLRMGPRTFSASLERVAPNLSVLKEQMGLDVRQITMMIKQAPSLITSSSEALMMKAKQAEELGVSRSSRKFVRALIVVSNLTQMTIQSRVNNLKRHGFSGEEVTTIVSKQPTVLNLQEELMTHKVEFLIKEVRCDKSYVIRNPILLTLSLNKRLIPRNLIRKLLELKDLLANRKFVTFAKLTEEQFVKMFVLPNEHAIPGLHQAYVDTCAGNIRGIEWFESASR